MHSCMRVKKRRLAHLGRQKGVCSQRIDERCQEEREPSQPCQSRGQCSCVALRRDWLSCPAHHSRTPVAQAASARANDKEPWVQPTAQECAAQPSSLVAAGKLVWVAGLKRGLRRGRQFRAPRHAQRVTSLLREQVARQRIAAHMPNQSLISSPIPDHAGSAIDGSGPVHTHVGQGQAGRGGPALGERASLQRCGHHRRPGLAPPPRHRQRSAGGAAARGCSAGACPLRTQHRVQAEAALPPPPAEASGRGPHRPGDGAPAQAWPELLRSGAAPAAHRQQGGWAGLLASRCLAATSRKGRGKSNAPVHLNATVRDQHKRSCIILHPPPLCAAKYPGNIIKAGAEFPTKWSSSE